TRAAAAADDPSPSDTGREAAGPPTTTAPVARPDDPALLPTLLELSLTRLLDLAEAHTRPRPPVRIDWLTDIKPVMVDIPTATSPPPDASDDPPF
ncbi:hypothetical protein, partial [Knoellia aerolata]|uniref:hypothetical protein n=1 Tax=Knoellia aerolata TaxID=442954 RepID=UPI0005693834